MKVFSYLTLLFLLLGFQIALSASVNDTVKMAKVDSLSHQYHLIKPVSEKVPNFSGDKQTQTARLTAEKPLRVLVLDEQDKPVEGVCIHFKPLVTPEKDKKFTIVDTVSCTDSSGIAETKVVLGSVEGEYQVAAQIKDFPTDEILVFRVFARKSNWVFLLIAGLIGGLGLFLLGIVITRKLISKNTSPGAEPCWIQPDSLPQGQPHTDVWIQLNLIHFFNTSAG
ncbi:MAG: hypothetical protein R6V16_02205 [Bacteroidales bacterium]